jgi:type IV secretion system protein VirB9
MTRSIFERALQTCLWTLACALLWAQAASASDVKTDSRIRTVVYQADEVYRLQGFVGYQIQLVFAPDEAFVGLAAGDIEALSFVAQGNSLFLKPRAPTAGTNVTVVTNRRTYQFDYRALAHRPGASSDDVIYSLRFAYAPEGRDGGAVAAQRISSDLAGASSTRARNVDYWYCGHPALQPVAVSDDGVHTRLRFAENAEWPAIFVRTEDGAETLLNFSVDQGDVVIHRIAHRFILRRGKLTGCIVNAGFAGAGDRLESGTVSPAVRRETQGGRP